MIRRMTLLVFVLLAANDCVRSEESEGWLPVERGEKLDNDLVDNALEIKTTRTLGSNARVKVRFYTAQDEYAGLFEIHLKSTPQYWLGWCSRSATDFPTTLPTATEKIWKFSLDKSSGIRVKIDCNGKRVLDVLLSDETCANKKWSIFWNRQLEKVQFDLLWHHGDTASEYYRLNPGWIPVTRSQYIDFDPENVPLEIQTNSVSGNGEQIILTFYSSQNIYAGGFMIKFSSKPKYLLPHCTSWTNFPRPLPDSATKIWRIAVQDIDPSVRLVVHCNEIQVLKVKLSNSTCSAEPNWSSFWRDDVKKIYFNSSDSASDFYRPYRGWIPVSNNFIDADIEDSPLMIKTKSALGSNAEIFLRFYTDQKTDAGGINIMFSRPPQYQLLNCSNLINFKQDLPTTLEKTWSITVNKTAGIRMMVHCNGELVIDEQLSEQRCASNSLSWSRYWSGYMKRVKFTAEDTASTHYKPTIEN